MLGNFVDGVFLSSATPEGVLAQLGEMENGQHQTSSLSQRKVPRPLHRLSPCECPRVDFRLLGETIRQTCGLVLLSIPCLIPTELGLCTVPP